MLNLSEKTQYLSTAQTDWNSATIFRNEYYKGPQLIGTLLQSSEANTIKEKLRSLGGWGRSHQAGGNKKIYLLSLHVLFFHFTSRDATLKNSFFQMSSYARANVRITYDKTKGKFPGECHML